MAQPPEGWTPRQKFAAVLEAASLSEAKLEAFFCHHGLRPEQVESWREQMLAGLEPAPILDRDSSFRAKALRAIDEHLADESFDVGALAAALALSRSLLFQRLQETGQPPPARLILERRLERAAELLAGESGAISDVAYAVGFGSASHFTYCFRRRFGIAPSAYRRKD